MGTLWSLTHNWFDIEGYSESNMRYLLLFQGFEEFGIIRKDGKTVYREWAPGAIAAQLIGDFNEWTGTWMERDEFGVFSVTLPDGEIPRCFTG